LVTLAGALIAIVSLLEAFASASMLRHRDISLLALTLLVPLACEMAFHGPAFTGIRHFLFLLPSLAALAGIGFNTIFDRFAARNRFAAGAAIAVMSACFLWDATTFVRLHPYENLAYNALVGGLKGAFRRYDMDYWFNSMPEAIRLLEAHVRETTPVEAGQDSRIYSVAVCGERLPFDRNVTLPQLHWDFRSEWDESEFFIAPTHMNCDRDLDGEVVGTVQRLGVPIAYVKDRRAIVKPPTTTASSPPSDPGTRAEAKNIR
jgi:hypothetical protein